MLYINHLEFWWWNLQPSSWISIFSQFSHNDISYVCIPLSFLLVFLFFCFYYVCIHTFMYILNVCVSVGWELSIVVSVLSYNLFFSFSVLFLLLSVVNSFNVNKKYIYILHEIEPMFYFDIAIASLLFFLAKRQRYIQVETLFTSEKNLSDQFPYKCSSCVGGQSKQIRTYLVQWPAACYG